MSRTTRESFRRMSGAAAGPAVSAEGAPPLVPGTRFLVLALAVMALAQGGLLLIVGHGLTRLVAVGLAIASLNLRLRALAILGGLILLNIAAHLAGIEPPIPYRLALVSLLALYGAIGLAALTALAFRVNAARAFVVTACLAIAVIAVEFVIERVIPIRITRQPQWIGRRQPHPSLGEVYAPYSVLKTIYPDNRRGFFDDAGPLPWRLDIHDAGSAASLERLADHPEVMRIQIARAQRPTPSNIQLTEPRLRVKGGESYNLTFRARADEPRRATYGLSMGHAPWRWLGLGREVEIGEDWREFSETFKAPADDERAQLFFNVGQNTPPVELEHVVLRRMPSTEVVTPPASSVPGPPNRYSLTYQFNAFGCRGRDYGIPRPAGTRRLLALGGGETLGVGVHEWETFAARLEQSLTPATDEPVRTTEVINCGADGYAAREKREFYEQIGAKYQPDLVVLSMTDQDYISPGDARRLGFVHDVSKLERLLLSAYLFQLSRYEWRAPALDFSTSLQDVVRLAEAARAGQARLAVVFFRIGPLAGAWGNLLRAASTTLKDAGIPFIDLGPELLKQHSPDALAVHLIDPHPNAIAHRIAARQIEEFLKRSHLID